MTTLAATELSKYQRIWKCPEYGRTSPGEDSVALFKRMVKRPRGSTLLDIGCGTGRASLALSGRYAVDQLDFVDALEEHVGELYRQNIWGRQWPDRTWDVGFCADVMEHIPPERVDVALRNIMAHTTTAWFRIDFGPDVFGPKVLDEPLHVTVKPFKWWRDMLRDFGDVRDARDLLGFGTFTVRA